MPHTVRTFRRLILGLQPGTSDRAMRLAAELAELLDLDLLGLFFEDRGLRELAGIPFAREFRPLGGGWQPFDLDRLAHDLEVAAASVERLFTNVVKDLGGHSQFEVMRGPVSETLASTSRASDIVVIMEPASAAERVSAQFSALIEAAFRSAAAVMLVPTRVARNSGPIVAIATTANDPSIAVAVSIAGAAKEAVIVLDTGGQNPADEQLSQLADKAGVTIRRIATRKLSTDPMACLEALHPLRERLLVMTRVPFDGEVASAIAGARQVPVLVIEPESLPPA